MFQLNGSEQVMMKETALGVLTAVAAAAAQTTACGFRRPSTLFRSRNLQGKEHTTEQ